MNSDNKQQLNIVSFNCNSIRRKVDIIRELMNDADILLCQEIILLNDDISFIDSLSDDFKSYSVPSIKINGDNLDGRPSGGLTLFWRKSLNINVNIICSNSHFIIANIIYSDKVFSITNVYLPCDDRSNDIIFRYEQLLGEIQAVLDGNNISSFVLMGDFNADPNRGRLWPLLQDFVNNNNLNVNNSHLPSNTFTYLSSAHNTTSWLDHIITSESITLTDVHVKYNCALFDHFPIAANVILDKTITINNFNNQINLEFYDWNKFDDEVKTIYNERVELHLSNCNLLDFICHDRNCVDDHRNNINIAFNHFIDSLKFGSKDYLINKYKKFVPVPGWNDYCKDLYREARRCFLEWLNNGRIRYGEYFERMKHSRKEFNRALNYCKSNRQKIQNEKLARSFKGCNNNYFWKEVKSRNNNKISIDEVDGVKGDLNLAQLFYNKFSSISGNDDNSLIYEYRGNNRNLIKFTVNDVKTAITSLKTGVGFDGIHSNHLKFLSHNPLMFLTVLINSCIIHNYIPGKVLEGVIRPIPKNRLGNLSDSSNYREIMVSSNLFKVIEYCFLPILLKNVNISPHQFGYRSGTSTLMPTVILKEILKTYDFNNSSVYASFLDLSKAFERVDHGILLNKLRHFNIPNYFINILEVILCNSQVCVSFNTCSSNKWFLKRGVRQGGILSAYLFIFYIDDILRSIFNKKVGCILGINRINILAYADDMVLISPTRSGLQLLLNRILVLMNREKLVFNVNKTVSMIFNSRGHNDGINFYLGNEKLEIVKDVKYLGCILTSNLTDRNDIERAMSSFNKSAGYVLRKFHYVNIDILLFLFNAYCSHFYGSELWFFRKKCKSTFKQLCVFYHSALKRVLNVPKFFSNHIVCDILNMLTCEHFINFKMIRFLFYLKNSFSPCFSIFKYYFITRSHFSNYIEGVFNEKYDIVNVLDNDLDAILSRIAFIQKREPSSMFLGLF